MAILSRTAESFVRLMLNKPHGMLWTSETSSRTTEYSPFPKTRPCGCVDEFALRFMLEGGAVFVWFEEMLAVWFEGGMTVVFDAVVLGGGVGGETTVVLVRFEVTVVFGTGEELAGGGYC